MTTDKSTHDATQEDTMVYIDQNDPSENRSCDHYGCDEPAVQLQEWHGEAVLWCDFHKSDEELWSQIK